MNLKPIFVTFALGLITATVAATPVPKNPVHEGNQKLAQLEIVRQDLALASIDLSEVRDAEGHLLNVESIQHDWGRYSKAEVAKLKSQLKTYLNTVGELMAIDSQKLVYIDHKEVLLRRQQVARAYLASLEQNSQNGLNRAK